MAPEIPPTANNAAAAAAGSLVKQPSISKCAYVTFLAGNGDYVKGVVGLAKGLRKVKSKYPLVVAILPDVPQEHRRILVSQGCIVREIEPVTPPDNQTQFAMAYYVINYSKLRIWKTTSLTSPTAVSTPSWTASARRHGATLLSTKSGTASRGPTRSSGPQNWAQSPHSTSTPECSFTSPVWPSTTSFWRSSRSHLRLRSQSRISSTCSSGTFTGRFLRATILCWLCFGATRRMCSLIKSKLFTTVLLDRSRGGIQEKKRTWIGMI
ncbi:Galactinol synthase 1 [Linum perenne]